MALGSIFIRPCPLKNRGRSTPCPFPQGGHGALHTPSSHGGHAHRGDRRRASKQKQVLGPDSKPCRRLGLWFSAVSVKPDTLLCAGKLGSSPDGSQARAQSARSCFAVKTVCSLRGSPGHGPPDARALRARTALRAGLIASHPLLCRPGESCLPSAGTQGPHGSAAAGLIPSAPVCLQVFPKSAAYR